MWADNTELHQYRSVIFGDVRCRRMTMTKLIDSFRNKPKTWRDFRVFRDELRASALCKVANNSVSRVQLFIDAWLVLYQWDFPNNKVNCFKYMPPVQWVPGVISRGLKCGRVVSLTTHLHLVPRSRMSRSYISSPPSAFVTCKWDSFSFKYMTRDYAYSCLFELHFQ
jgi:hypothetical protein